jgi:hypothetical protein
MVPVFKFPLASQFCKLLRIIGVRYQESRVFASFRKKTSGRRVGYATVELPSIGVEAALGAPQAAKNRSAQRAPARESGSRIVPVHGTGAREM